MIKTYIQRWSCSITLLSVWIFEIQRINGEEKIIKITREHDSSQVALHVVSSILIKHVPLQYVYAVRQSKPTGQNLNIESTGTGTSLSPPWSFTSSEICFRPWNEDYLTIFNVGMSQCQWLHQKSRMEVHYYHQFCYYEIECMPYLIANITWKEIKNHES